MVKFDHAYCFTTSALKEVQILEQNGFELTQGRRHQGQGTANRSVLCSNGYIELIFIDSPEEALNNSLNLSRRSEWKKTRFSPFGIGMSGVLDSSEAADYWDYDPPYLKGSVIKIHKSNELFPALPMYFIMDPSYRKVEAKSGWPTIQQIEISVLTDAVLLEVASSLIRLNHSTQPEMIVTFEGHKNRILVLNELLKFIV